MGTRCGVQLLTAANVSRLVSLPALKIPSAETPSRILLHDSLVCAYSEGIMLRVGHRLDTVRRTSKVVELFMLPGEAINRFVQV